MKNPKDGERYRDIYGAWHTWHNGQANPKPLTEEYIEKQRLKKSVLKKESETYSEKLLSPKWQKKRLEILQRDNFTCQACQNDKDTLHVHHLYYDKKLQPWEYEDKYLITLCDRCHTAWHVLDKSGIGWDIISAISNLFDKIFDGN